MTFMIVIINKGEIILKSDSSLFEGIRIDNY